VNDRHEDAWALAHLLARRKAHANLIPYNPVAGLPYQRPAPEAVRRFVEILKSAGVSVTVRKTKGRSIDAACGQLRRRFEAGAEIEKAAGPAGSIPLARVVEASEAVTGGTFRGERRDP
jgi:hypothetical protein